MWVNRSFDNIFQSSSHPVLLTTYSCVYKSSRSWNFRQTHVQVWCSLYTHSSLREGLTFYIFFGPCYPGLYFGPYVFSPLFIFFLCLFVLTGHIHFHFEWWYTSLFSLCNFPFLFVSFFDQHSLMDGHKVIMASIRFILPCFVVDSSSQSFLLSLSFFFFHIFSPSIYSFFFVGCITEAF